LSHPAASGVALAEKKSYIAEIISINSKAQTATEYLRELNTKMAETTKLAGILYCLFSYLLLEL
jgi:hypothetical protein